MEINITQLSRARKLRTINNRTKIEKEQTVK